MTATCVKCGAIVVGPTAEAVRLRGSIQVAPGRGGKLVVPPNGRPNGADELSDDMLEWIGFQREWALHFGQPTSQVVHETVGPDGLHDLLRAQIIGQELSGLYLLLMAQSSDPKLEEWRQIVRRNVLHILGVELPAEPIRKAD